MSRGEANEVEGWVPSRGVQIPWKTFQKDLENLLTNTIEYGILIMSRGKSPQGTPRRVIKVHQVKKDREKSAKNSLLTNPLNVV